MKVRILSLVSRRHTRRNPVDPVTDGNRLDYPQTWYLLARATGHRHWLQRPFRWLCGRWGGHELSKTEKGYGGGEFLDVHCRWCDQQIKVPFSEMIGNDWMKDMFNQTPPS